MREPTTLRLGDNVYIIGDWSVDKSLKTLVWLTKNFGEGIMGLFMEKETLKKPEGETKEDTSEGSHEEEAFRDFFKSVIEKLDPDEYTKYARIIVEGTKCNAKDINFNFHFIGKMGELHKLMFAILRHQYSDFLPEGVGEGWL